MKAELGNFDFIYHLSYHQSFVIFIIDRIRKIKSVTVFGDPEVSVVAIGSDVFDIFRLSNALTTKGWNLNTLQYPSRYCQKKIVTIIFIQTKL